MAVLVVLALAACSAPGSGPEEDQPDPAAVAAEDFLEAWSAGDHQRAAALTDAPVEAETLLDEVAETLRVTAVAAEPGEVTRPTKDGDEATTAAVPFEATMSLETLGDWAYDGQLPLVATGEGDEQRWLVDWSPAAVHPSLTAETRLSRSRELPPRAPVLDRSGEPLMTERPVVDIGVEPRRLTEAERAYDALAALGVDPARLREQVTTARPDQYVHAITLRQEDFAPVQAELRDIPGLVFREETTTLAPTPTFGRALLGTVRPATAETLADAGPLASPFDDVGATGLQRTYQQQLAGEPGGEVRLVRRADDEVLEVLHTFPAAPGTPLQTTLDRQVQAAAEAALAPLESPAALVAVQPSTGEVLAAASAPASDGLDRAMVGRYPPGSTFKVVTAAALLRDGLDPADIVPCPATVTVNGREFGNYDALGALGEVPFRRDFVESCNTAFITAAGELPDGALPEAAALFGLGEDWDLGTDAFSGSVPPPDGPVEKAAAAIGQGTVLASPLSMAVVAAAVADGTARVPVLLPGQAPLAAGAPAPLPGDLGDTLRSLMLATVEEGTAQVLDLPGEPVGGKTGTAEYGEQVPPETHAWIIGFRGDLAFAVLVEGGESGGRIAGPVARRFLEAVPASQPQ